jgi:hypothetical protein
MIGPSVTEWETLCRELLLFFQTARPADIARLDIAELREVKEIVCRWTSVFREGKGEVRIVRAFHAGYRFAQRRAH